MINYITRLKQYYWKHLVGFTRRHWINKYIMLQAIPVEAPVVVTFVIREHQNIFGFSRFKVELHLGDDIQHETEYVFKSYRTANNYLTAVGRDILSAISSKS